MNFRSISFRLVAWYGGLLAGIFLLLCALLYLDLRHFLENDLRDSQARRARQIANTLLVNVRETGEAFVAHQTADWYDPDVNDRFIRITRANGTLVYLSRAPKDGSFDPAEVPLLPSSSKTEFSHLQKLSGGGTLLIAALNFKSSGNPDYIVEFGSLLDPVESMLDHLFLQLALGLPVAVIIITAGGYVLVRRALAPVEKITRAAERITQHNLSERLPVAHTGDELERLSLALNRMITRLDDAFQNSKRFVADASHDLRTPLTILRGELEDFCGDPRLVPDLASGRPACWRSPCTSAKSWNSYLPSRGWMPARRRPNGRALTCANWPKAPPTRCASWPRTKKFPSRAAPTSRFWWKATACG